jgi:HAMP domain-containing protein
MNCTSQGFNASNALEYVFSVWLFVVAIVVLWFIARWLNEKIKEEEKVTK